MLIIRIKLRLKFFLDMINKVSISLLGILILFSTNIKAIDEKKFKDWQYQCELSDKIKNCYISQQLSSKNVNPKTKKVTYTKVVGYKIGYFGGEKNKKTLQLHQELPVPIQIPAGTALVQNKSEILSKGSYILCSQNICIASADISENTLKKMISSKDLSVAYLDASTKQFYLPIFVDGLKEAIEYLKSKK